MVSTSTTTMSTSSSSFALSPQTRSLLGTALLSCLITIGISRLYTSYVGQGEVETKVKKSKRRKSIIARKIEEGEGSGSVHKYESGRIENSFSEELIKEYLSRNISFLGIQGIERLRESLVVIVGLGGVGVNVALALARSGIGRLRLIDFDLVGLSSLNRHTPSTVEDVGLPKVKVTKDWIKKIAPWVQVEEIIGLYGKEEELDEKILGGNPDWVVDCIDNIDTKVKLLVTCHKRGIKVFSSMGAGSKVDPARIQIGDISATSEDPLSRSVRRRLRLEGVITGIPTIFSTEVPDRAVSLLPLPENEFQAQDVNELSTLDNFRVRILPVLGMLPNIFGNAIATYLICDLSKWGREKEWLVVRNRPKVYDKCWTRLKGFENKLKSSNDEEGGGELRGLTKEEMIYVFEEIFIGRSAIDRSLIPSKPTMVRWDRNLPLSWSNLVLLERNEAERHEKEHFGAQKSLEQIWGQEVVKRIHERLDKEKKWREGWERDW